MKLKKYISEIKINLIILEFFIFNCVSIQIFTYWQINESSYHQLDDYVYSILLLTLELGININIILTFRPCELWYIYSIPSGGFLS